MSKDLNFGSKRLDVASRCLHLQIYRDPSLIEDVWREFEKTAFGTLFQSYTWVSAWCKNAAQAHGEDPVLAVWFDNNGSIVVIWPLAITSYLGARVLVWLGQKHTNYNMGLYRNEIVDSIDEAMLRRMIQDVADSIPEATAMHFIDQPTQLNGQANPFGRLPHSPSANISYELTLQRSPETLFKSALSKDGRRLFKRVERLLSEAGPVEIGLAETQEQKQELFSRFMHQRAAQFERLKVANIFAPPATQSFYHALFTEQGGAGIESAYLKLGGQIIATSNGMTFQDRFYHLTLSMSLEADERLSPGRMLSKEHMARHCREGTNIFDFGPGPGHHKTVWHPRQNAYFETYFTLRGTGLPLTILRRASSHIRFAALSSPKIQSAIRTSKNAMHRTLQALTAR